MLMGKEGETDPSTVTKMDKPEGKLEIREQNEGRDTKEGS